MRLIIVSKASKAKPQTYLPIDKQIDLGAYFAFHSLTKKSRLLRLSDNSGDELLTELTKEIHELKEVWVYDDELLVFNNQETTNKIQDVLKNNNITTIVHTKIFKPFDNLNKKDSENDFNMYMQNCFLVNQIQQLNQSIDRFKKKLGK